MLDYFPRHLRCVPRVRQHLEGMLGAKNKSTMRGFGPNGYLPLTSFSGPMDYEGSDSMDLANGPQSLFLR